jgi:hypothetical protein
MSWIIASSYLTLGKYFDATRIALGRGALFYPV